VGVPALDRVSLAAALPEAVTVIAPGQREIPLLTSSPGWISRSADSHGRRAAGRHPERDPGARHRRRQIGIIFQLSNLLDDQAMADNVPLPAQPTGTQQAKAGPAGDRESANTAPLAGDPASRPTGTGDLCAAYFSYLTQAKNKESAIRRQEQRFWSCRWWVAGPVGLAGPCERRWGCAVRPGQVLTAALGSAVP
jgi:hypothetical protein